MSEHSLILEFYKPTYNLDFDYNNDGGLDLHFTNIKGEFFMTMNDSYNSVYIEDEDCEFSKGEMFATVDLGDLVERIINGEFRQTNGKAVSDWGKRFLGDGEEKIEFNGKNYADGSLFWDDFFKEMSKDEIKDFLKFCEDYLYLPNIEVDTVSNKWDFENGKVELKSNDKWGIGISDDYNIIVVNEFTCDSEDAFVAYDVASSESDENDYYESKKCARKSIKESKIDYVFEDLANEYVDEYCNSHGGNFTKESIRQAFLDGCNDKKAPKGYHEFVAWQAGQRQIGKKSLKESFEYDGTIPFDELMNILTDEWQENNTNNLLFRESSHWEDSARDENKYIEISAIIDFTVPWASGFGFSNKKVQKDYDKEIESVEKHYTFEDNDDYNKMTDELNEYQPILFVLVINLKEKIIYADVDLGNGLGSTEVARERLAENEDDFRKQIQRMIESF